MKYRIIKEIKNDGDPNFYIEIKKSFFWFWEYLPGSVNSSLENTHAFLVKLKECDFENKKIVEEGKLK